MKPKVEKPKVGTPVRDNVDKVETVETKEEQKAQPVKVEKKTTTYRVKCIWSSSVKVSASRTPSCTAYEFQPNQEMDITSNADALYLVGLKRGESGCCGSSGKPRNYFELV